MKTEDTEVLGRRELNQARSKPDTVNWPVRTAGTFVHHYNSTQYHNTEFFFQYSPSSRPTSHLRYGQVEVRGGGEVIQINEFTDLLVKAVDFYHPLSPVTILAIFADCFSAIFAI